jgi:hypothetical protein
MATRTTKLLWRGHRRRLEGQITEYAGMLRAVEGRLLRMRGRLQRRTGDAQVQLATALDQLEEAYRQLVEGWQAILKGLDQTFSAGRQIAQEAIARADAVMTESPCLLSDAAKVLRRARAEAAAIRKGVQVGLRRGRRLAAVARRRRAGRPRS